MAKASLISRLKWLWHFNRRNRSQGFTLLELLVVTVIAAGIVSGLVYIVVELMGADQRETSLTETQREMQLALNYISNEMQEAVFVYTGTCFDGTDAACTRPGAGVPLTNFLPSSVTGGGVPIVAFWRQYPLPANMRNSGVCASGTSTTPLVCVNGNSYALIVYSITTKADPTWKGQARVTRYALTQYDTSGNASGGYADPASTSFETWPFQKQQDGSFKDMRNTPQPSGSSVVLVDFVDGGTNTEDTGTQFTKSQCPDNPATVDDPSTPTINEGLDYLLTPTDAFLGSNGGTNLRSSFYACVSPSQKNYNQDVILYLRGNATGKPGVKQLNRGSALPAIETRVFVRGILDKIPPQ
jgi:prepilin-type N-terminal cleavage/methylation domain-containing protein